MLCRLTLLIVCALGATRVMDAQDTTRLRRIYWEVDSMGAHFEPQQMTVYRGDTVRFLLRSGPPHSLTFDSTAVPTLALEPLRRMMARLPRASDEPFATRSLYNVGETVNIITDSLPPGRYLFYCEEHDDEEGTLIVEERPGTSFADYFGSIGTENANIWAAEAIDSIVFERSTCMQAGCSGYQFALARSGAVQYRQQGPGAAAPITASVARSVATRLFTATDTAGLFVLPNPVQEDPQLCPVRATGRTVLIVTAYRKGGRRQVEYNTGCFVSTQSQGLIVAEPLKRFASWESAVESAVGVSRWPH